MKHGVEQDAEPELAARTVGLQRQLGLEVHVEGETSEHLFEDSFAWLGAASILYNQL